MTVDTIQTDILVRLRIIEALQHYSYPRLSLPCSDDFVIEILNWISCFLVQDPTSEPIASAISCEPGRVTLYVANQHASNADSSRTGLQASFFKLFYVLKEVLANELSPRLASRKFFALIVHNVQQKIEHKLALLGHTDGEPGQTCYRFNSLVSAWLLYRPEGEQSRGLTNLAISHGSGADCVNEYLLQSFITVTHHESSEKLTTEQRRSRVINAVTGCSLLIHSTFFDDLLNHHTFRLSLKVEDRIFLLKLHRRLSRIAAYKTGAAQLSFFGLPFLRTVLGPEGLADFIQGTGHRGIHVHIVSPLDSSSSKVIPYPSSPTEVLPFILGLFSDGESTPAHSRNASGNSQSTTSSGSLEHYDHRELSQLDNQLRFELLNSDLLATAWLKDEKAHLKLHCELQLIHFLEANGLTVVCHAFGTSKPVCWACECFLENIHATQQQPPAEEEEVQRWWYSKRHRKVYSNWLIPPAVQRIVLDAVLDASQYEMERVIEEVAFDSYL